MSAAAGSDAHARSNHESSHGSLRVSLLYLLLGDVAAVLALLGVVSRGVQGGLLLIGAMTVPLVAIAMVRPYLLRLAWGQQVRSWRASIPHLAGAGLGAAALALSLGLGTLGHDGGELLSADDLGPVDELVVVPPGTDFAATADVVNQTLGVPEVRALIDSDPLPIRRTLAVVSRPGLAAVSVQLLELDTVRASRFGGDPASSVLPAAPLAPNHAFATTDLASALGLHPGSVIPAPLNITIDAVLERRGVTGLPSAAHERVPNLIVGSGTIDALRSNGWSASVDSLLALSNAGGTMDGAVYSDRVAAAVRGALSNATQVDRDVLFAPEPVDEGLDRVVVETVKTAAIRRAAERRQATEAPLGTVSVVAATAAAGLIAAATALSVSKRRRDIATMRTAGMSRSAAVSVQVIACWLTHLIPTLLGSVAGALLAQLAAGSAVVRVGGVSTSLPRVDAGAALSFSWGLALVVLILTGAMVAWSGVRTSVSVGRRRELGFHRQPWGRTASIATVVAGAVLLGLGLAGGSDAAVTGGSALVVIAIAGITGIAPLLALLLPLGIIGAGPVGSRWESSGAGASVALLCTVTGAVTALWWVISTFISARMKSDSVDAGALVTRPGTAGSARPAVVAGMALLIAAGGVSGSIVAAAADLPGPGAQPVLVRSLAEPAVRPDEIQPIPGVGRISALSLDQIDISFDGGSLFVGAPMISGPADLGTGSLPDARGPAAWSSALGSDQAVVVAPDLVPVGVSVGPDTTVVLRDRLNARTLTVKVAGVLTAPNALGSVWTAEATASALSGTPPDQALLVVTPAPGADRALITAALTKALRGRAARVDTRDTVAAERWPLAPRMLSMTRRAVALVWVVAAGALSLLVLRSLIERRRQLRDLQASMRTAGALRGVLVRDSALLVVVGTLGGVVVGIAYAMRLIGRPDAPARVVLPVIGILGAPVATIVLTALCSGLMARWSTAHRSQRSSAA